MPIDCSIRGSASASLERPRPATLNNASAVEPLVSIVVPIYDRAAEIIRLAHSIYQQDYPWIEVVLVANGSPRDSPGDPDRQRTT